MKIKRPKLTLFERLYLPALWNGFKVTLRHFFSWKKSEVYADKNEGYDFKATLKYPEELWTVPKGFRGAPYLVKDQNDATKCVSCQLCEFVCPPKAIRIVPPGEDGAAADRANAEKLPKEFEIDMLRCIFCGMCVEACPEDAIVMTDRSELAAGSRAELIYTKEMLLAVDSRVTLTPTRKPLENAY